MFMSEQITANDLQTLRSIKDHLEQMKGQLLELKERDMQAHEKEPFQKAAKHLERAQIRIDQSINVFIEVVK